MAYDPTGSDLYGAIKQAPRIRAELCFSVAFFFLAWWQQAELQAFNRPRTPYFNIAIT